ncbi:MAG: hypothetical protein NVS9B15_12710 [Acidobacteriaceae bacterium]
MHPGEALAFLREFYELAGQNHRDASLHTFDLFREEFSGSGEDGAIKVALFTVADAMMIEHQHSRTSRECFEQT